jgi:hypothetical protein
MQLTTPFIGIFNSLAQGQKGRNQNPTLTQLILSATTSTDIPDHT